MCRTGPIDATACSSSAVSATGDHTHAVPSASLATAMRVGWGRPRNRTVGPSATYSEGPNWVTMWLALEKSQDAASGCAVVRILGREGLHGTLAIGIFRLRVG